MADCTHQTSSQLKCYDFIVSDYHDRCQGAKERPQNLCVKRCVTGSQKLVRDDFNLLLHQENGEQTVKEWGQVRH